MGQKKYRLGLYEKAMPSWLTWAEKLAAAKTAGFDALEISIDETDEKLARLLMPKQERQALCQTMSKTGLCLESMCLSGHRKYPLGSENSATRARSLEIMHQAILLARDLGIPLIQLAGYDVYYEEGNGKTRAFFGENLAKSVEMAAEYGVVLAFETMETPFLNTVTKAMEWVDLIGSPYLQVYPDTGNLTNAALASGQSVFADLERGRGHLAALHLKETVPGKFREIPFGTGHVPFPALIDLAYAMGVRRYTGEFWYVGQENWHQALTDAATFLRSQFDLSSLK